MVIKDLLLYGNMQLKNSGLKTPQLDAAVLLCCLLKCDRVYITVNDKLQVSPETEAEYKKMIFKRKNHMPVSYITHLKEFMSLNFYVDQNVLIPRPDTETLVEYIIEKKCKKDLILDLCCGSGCIGISLSHYLKNTNVVMADISEEALEISKRNAFYNNVGNCEFLKIDVFKEFPRQKFDVIVSNPPYIDKKTLKTLEKDVLDYEPVLALDGGESGLIFYETICNKAFDALNDEGILAFEIGEGQGRDVFEIMKKNNFKDIEIINDLAGKNRVVSGRKRDT